MYRPLKRVEIPIFSGKKMEYKNWKAAFVACVDRASVSPEYKLLQMRQCLTREALQVARDLGHSSAAYDVGKRHLDRRFDGDRRCIARLHAAIEKAKPVPPGNLKDLELSVDLLDIVVINLKYAEQIDELKAGSLYLQVQKKLPETLLTHYDRRIFEKGKEQSVEELLEWVTREAEIQSVSSEAIHGLSSSTSSISTGPNPGSVPAIPHNTLIDALMSALLSC